MVSKLQQSRMFPQKLLPFALFSFTAWILFKSSDALLFQKRIALTDPDYPTQFTALSDSPAKPMSSPILCAAHAISSSNHPSKSHRASAFHFNGSSCQLGQTPPFIDALQERKVLANGESIGAHVVMGIKPLSLVAHAGLYIYVLLNEQQYFNAHKNLPNPPDPNFYDGVNNKFSFTMLSPVQTLEGQYAAQPVGNTSLQFSIATRNFTAFTALVWYNPGASTATLQPLFTMTIPGNDESGFTAWTSQFYPGDITIRVYNVIGDVGQVVVAPSGSVVVDTWHYIGLAYDGVNGLLSIYLNGTNMASQSNAAFLGEVANVSLLQIGYRHNLAGEFFMENYIASFELYDSYMTAYQVMDAMAKSTTTRVLV